MKTTSTGPLLFTDDLTRLFRCERHAIQQRVDRRELPPPMKMGNKNAWDKSLLETWIRRRAIQAGQADHETDAMPPVAKDSLRLINVQYVDLPVEESKKTLAAALDVSPEDQDFQETIGAYVDRKAAKAKQDVSEAVWQLR